MTELQRQFIDETGVSFDGIPINGIHLQYITWLEAQMQALRIHDVVGRSEQLNTDLENEVFNNDKDWATNEDVDEHFRSV